MVVKSVVVATLITGSCRAVVVTVVPRAVVVPTVTTGTNRTEPDREVFATEVDTGAIVVAVSVSIVEEHITTEGDLSVLESEGVTALRLS